MALAQFEDAVVAPALVHAEDPQAPARRRGPADGRDVEAFAVVLDVCRTRGQHMHLRACAARASAAGRVSDSRPPVKTTVLPASGPAFFFGGAAIVTPRWSTSSISSGRITATISRGVTASAPGSPPK